MTDIEKLQKFIDESNNIVFLGGAGVSTESGIPDFRSTDGLYSQTYGNKRPEYILSKTCWKKETDLFWKFYKEKILLNGKKVEPNISHIKLAQLEKAGKLKAIITQNIDTLHQEVGSINVLQIHGVIKNNHCVNTICKKEYDISEIFDKVDENDIPICPICGSKIKPDVVLYEEDLPKDVWANAVKAVKNADLFIIAGTSLRVYPAASLIDFYRGAKLVIINMSETQEDYVADLVIHDKLGNVFSQINV